jgi:hypothetical protein
MSTSDAMSALNELDYYFEMKPGSIGDPDIYLGGKLRKVALPNGVEAWGISPSKYVQEAVKNAEADTSRRTSAGARDSKGRRCHSRTTTRQSWIRHRH